jgi:hypothetical protein
MIVSEVAFMESASSVRMIQKTGFLCEGKGPTYVALLMVNLRGQRGLNDIIASVLTPQGKLTRLLHRGAFRVQFPNDVTHCDIGLQIHRRVMVLDGLGSFGIDVACHDDLGLRMLVGQGIHFTDCDGLIDRMPLMHESFSERMRSYSSEQGSGSISLAFNAFQINIKVVMALLDLLLRLLETPFRGGETSSPSFLKSVN